MTQPMRKVTGRTGSHRNWNRGADGRAHWFSYVLESLECGHQLRMPVKYPRAARRRCDQCPALTSE